MTSDDNNEQGPTTAPTSDTAAEPQVLKEQDANAGGGEKPAKSPKKRRKVNHACLYCRRSHMTCDTERPCTRCIKRNIGHLCHDEEPTKKPKSKHEAAHSEPNAQKATSSTPDVAAATTATHEPRTHSQTAQVGLAPPRLQQETIASTRTIGPNVPASAPQAQAVSSNNRSFLGYDDWNAGSPFQDMHNLHPSYMFNTSEVHNEYNLLNDFLSSSLMDDGTVLQGDEIHGVFSDPLLSQTMGAASASAAMPPPSSILPQHQQQQQQQHQREQQQSSSSSSAAGASGGRPTSGFPTEEAREKYYMMAADPAGLDAPEERMNKLLKAKQDAGLLKPFNYVKGYERLNTFIKKNLHLHHQNRILRQLDRFRPQFRERMQSLTDLQLIRVEMWFERCLMEYDRLFSSMAIPACCWRRTGEIFRGNKEMAELIHVPIEKLRDGNLAIHEIITEDSLVGYWEKFGAIAFDASQKAILTHCSLKNPDPKANEPEIRCCFSFTIRRDQYSIPSIIVGNFLPIAPSDS